MRPFRFDFFGSPFFHILGKDSRLTPSKLTEHIRNLVPGLGLKFFLLVLTNQRHTSLVSTDGLCKPIPTARLERLLRSWTTHCGDFPPSIKCCEFNTANCKNNASKSEQCTSISTSTYSSTQQSPYLTCGCFCLGGLIHLYKPF